MEQWMFDTIQNKNRDIFKKRHWYNTPLETDEWDCIFENKGHGIPIWACGDTSDKLVISVKHMDEYKELYNFCIEGDGDGWDNSVSEEMKNEANIKLYRLGLYLSEIYPIYLCFVDAQCKGNTSFFLEDIKKLSYEEFENIISRYDQLLLFVKTTDSEIDLLSRSDY